MNVQRKLRRLSTHRREPHPYRRWGPLSCRCTHSSRLCKAISYAEKTDIRGLAHTILGILLVIEGGA